MIGLIACSKTKAKKRCKASEMYTGAMFQLSVRLMEKWKCPYMIISAKYGLIDPDTIINPYELKMTDLTMPQREEMAKKINAGLKSRLRKDEIVLCLMGIEYMLFARDIPVLMPMVGMGIGRRLQFLKSMLEKK